MLNQHSHTVIPESDHLRIGDCVLDLPRREIASPHGDAPMRITVKSLQVLLVLVAQQGKVVSREALIEWVWADTMPSDDVLTQAITQLRKAFGDDRGAPKYVETIAKGGYRLLAPVEWIQPADAGDRRRRHHHAPAPAHAAHRHLAFAHALRGQRAAQARVGDGVCRDPLRIGALPRIVQAIGLQCRGPDQGRHRQRQHDQGDQHFQQRETRRLSAHRHGPAAHRRRRRATIAAGAPGPTGPA